MGEEGESFLIETGWADALDMHDCLISHKSCDTNAAILVSTLLYTNIIHSNY